MKFKARIGLGVIMVLMLHFKTGISQQKQPARKDLLNISLNQSISNLEMKEVTLLAGQLAPKHLHPCPVVGYVVSGNVFFQIEGEESRILKAGDAFFEPKNKVVLHFDNASKDKPLVFMALYLKEHDEENTKIIHD